MVASSCHRMRLGAGAPSFHIKLRLYFTGILDKEHWVSMKTRLRWAGLSLTPLALLAIALAITAVTIGKNAADSGADDSFLVFFTPVGFVAGLLVVGVIAGNWLIFKRFRVAFPRNSNSPTS